MAAASKICTMLLRVPMQISGRCKCKTDGEVTDVDFEEVKDEKKIFFVVIVSMKRLLEIRGAFYFCQLF